MKKNQHGFSIVEGLLILVIVGLIAFVGWYVVDAKNDTDKLSSPSSTTSTTKPTDNKGEKTYKLIHEKLSFKYPSDWKVKYFSNPTKDYTTLDQDTVTITSPNNLDIDIQTGAFYIEHPQYGPSVMFNVVNSQKINTLGGEHYLNFLSMNGKLSRIFVSRSQKPPVDGSSNPSSTDNDWPVSKNITLKEAQPNPVDTKTYIEINVYYKDNGEATTDTYLKDPNFAIAKRIIESLRY